MTKSNFMRIPVTRTTLLGCAAMLGTMSVCAAQAGEVPVTRIPVTAFQQAVIDPSYERVVVMDFYADWCSACRQMGPDLSAVAAAYEDRVSVVQVDGDEAEVLAERFDISGFPALIAFSEGTVVDMLKGANPREVLNQWFAILAGESDPTLTEKE